MSHRTTKVGTRSARHRVLAQCLAIPALLVIVPTAAAVLVTGGVASAGTAGTVCAVTQDEGVVRFESAGQWRMIESHPGARVAAGGAGIVMLNYQSNATLRYTGTPGRWEWIGKAPQGIEVAVGRDAIYELTPSGGVFEYLGSARWRQIGQIAEAEYIFAGGAGLAVSDDSTMYRYLGTPNQWSPMGGGGESHAAAISDDSFYVTGAAGVVRYDAGSGGPQQLSVSGGAIRAGGHTLVMVNPSDNGLWRYTGRDARWQRIAPPGADYAVSSSDIFATTPDLRQVWQYTGSGSDWVHVGDFGRVNSLFACP